MPKLLRRRNNSESQDRGIMLLLRPIARSLVMMEALIGQLYPAILLARLVSLEIETRRSKKG